MGIQTRIDEQTVCSNCRAQKPGRSSLAIIGSGLPQFGLKGLKERRKTFFVRALCLVRPPMTILGTTDEMTAADWSTDILAPACTGSGPLDTVHQRVVNQAHEVRTGAS